MSDVFESGIFGANRVAAEEASGIQAATGQQSLAEQRRQFDLIQENLRPFREIGNQAYQQQLASQVGVGGLPADPSAAFRNQLQTRELNRNLAARGGLGGGNRLRALQSQAMAQAMTDEGNQFERLGALSGRGTGATSELGQAGSQFAGTIGQTMQDVANAQASGLIGAQQANQQTAGGIASGVGAALSLFSDENLKENIEPIESALDKVEKIGGVTWDWKENGEADAGVIAQEVEKVLPEAVFEVDGVKVVNYGALIGLQMQAIKELKELNNG